MSTRSTPEAPLAVRTVSQMLKGWIDRLGDIWVEGQITQLNVRRGAKVSFLVLRDTSADMSLKVTCPTQLLVNSPVPLQEGSRIILHGKFSLYPARGDISLWAREIRPVGLGELLARIERLRSLLAAEGLFAPERKRPIPFLPQRIGLVTGRDSAAEQDVLSVSTARWPDVHFRILHCLMQGNQAVSQIIPALQELDADPTIDVIILARGGGSVEDLLPFSEEALVRAISALRTPVVSAIGHEPDRPLCDEVADLRAATPTDAAKRVVPDVLAERRLVSELRRRSASALRGWVAREYQQLTALRSRPVLAQPLARLEGYQQAVEQDLSRLRRELYHVLRQEDQLIDTLRAQLTTLGPAATLARGYAVVQVLPREDPNPEIVTTIAQSPPGSQLRIRVADGSISAAAMGTTPAD